jgi:hypothetical protein
MYREMGVMGSALAYRSCAARWPRLLRGDHDWGTDGNMRRCEQEGLPYLLKQSKTQAHQGSGRGLVARCPLERCWTRLTGDRGPERHWPESENSSFFGHESSGTQHHVEPARLEGDLLIHFAQLADAGLVTLDAEHAPTP